MTTQRKNRQDPLVFEYNEYQAIPKLKKEVFSDTSLSLDEKIKRYNLIIKRENYLKEKLGKIIKHD